MSSTEIIVIAIGLVFGYWIVMKLMGGGSAQEEPLRRDASDRAEEPGDETLLPIEWHVLLDIDRTASVAQIRAAYQAQLAQYHPDRVAHFGADIRAAAEQRRRAIEIAYHEAMHERGYE